MNNSNETSNLFEARLIKVLTELPHLNNGLGNLAAALEAQTGKTWNKKKLYYMVKGEGYAKQWQLEAMLKMALINNWLPTNMNDWMHIIWTLTGKKQSAQGGYNGEIYARLAELSDKSEFIFEENYKKLMETNYGE